MNKYFLVGFALMLLGLNVGLRTGNWLGPKKVQVVRMKAKKQKPIIKVVKVEVPAAPVACIEPAPKKWVKRAVSSLGKPRKARPIAAVPAPIVPPAAAPAPAVVPTGPAVPPEVTSVDRKSASDIVGQTMKVENDGTGPALLAPVIKSIQTEE